MITASCHCGNVKIVFPDIIKTVTRCNCSACSKYAALWAYFSPESIKIIEKNNAISSYCWGDKTIEFHHCNGCGCLTHYTPTAQGNKGRMAVNFCLLPASALDNVNIRYFDGANTWTEITD